MNTKDPNVSKDKTGILRIFQAFKNSLDGLKFAFRERAFIQEAIISVILIPIAFMLSLSGMLILLIIFAHFIVLITELLNSGIEAVVDMFTKEYHELAKKAKDLGSAAVLLSLANLTIVWGYAFYSIILK